MKKQNEMNTDAMYTNEEFLKMGKVQFCKIVAAFEQAMVGSAQEKLQQRSDLEALVEQIEQETLEQHGGEVLQLWKEAKQAVQDLATTGDAETNLERLKYQEQCATAKQVLEDVLGTVSLEQEVALGSSASASTGGAGQMADEVSPSTENKQMLLDALLKRLELGARRLAAGGEIPCHFTTLTTAIYHWQDLATVLETYETEVTRRRDGRMDPLEPSERRLSAQRRRVLKYPGVVAWFTAYKMELFYKHVLKYEDGEGVFEWGAGGIMHLHSINFGSHMPRVDPQKGDWHLPTWDSVGAAREFASAHEEYLTDWSSGKAEKWTKQDIENAAARRIGGDSPLHTDDESDGSEDLEPDLKRSRTQERLPGAGASLLTAGTEETDDHDALQLFPFELDQEQLPEDVDFVRIFTSPTQFTYQLDDAGKRQRVVLSAEQKELLVELDSLMQQKDWHPCAIPMKHKAVHHD